MQDKIRRNITGPERVHSYSVRGYCSRPMVSCRHNKNDTDALAECRANMRLLKEIRTLLDLAVRLSQNRRVMDEVFRIAMGGIPPEEREALQSFTMVRTELESLILLAQAIVGRIKKDPVISSI
jgi:hypothetical protein